MATTNKKIRLPADLRALRESGQRIAVLTAYDFTFARLLAPHADVLLVGDSLGHVFQGKSNTLEVTVDQMVYHTAAVRRGAPDTYIVSDMPFLSWNTGSRDTLRNAGKLVAGGGADAVKLEGDFPEEISLITRAGIPVWAHLGLTPQSSLALGHRLQARDSQARADLLAAALRLESAGASALVLEMVPASLAAQVTRSLSIPVIGIGAGPDTNGQVLVSTDMLGANPGFHPRFLRQYARLDEIVSSAAAEFAKDVYEGYYPSAQESFDPPAD